MSDGKYRLKKYFAMSLDPIHIGTGGYRLGRVDNTIVRESGTNLPKIPGTSIEGSARTYVYYAEQGVNGINESCAVGKSSASDEQPCGVCPVCVAFGFTRKDKSFHGMVQFNDARILFFPVHSMLGPVWITTPNLLSERELGEFSVSDENIKTDLIDEDKKLNLGWLYLKNEGKFNLESENKLVCLPSNIKNRLVLVSDKLFDRIVNSNLEVRTSVSIDPKTGTAEDGALFTYEAIPRATILCFELVVNDPRNFEINNSEIKTEKDVLNEVEKSFDYFEALGVGGMQTRGFGRLKIWEVDSNGSQ